MNMIDNDVRIMGLVRDYPDFKIGTSEFIDVLGNKLTDHVKENILQLGVNNRHFIRPLDQYLTNSGQNIKSVNDGEPISDLCVKVANRCIQELGLKKEEITAVVTAYEDHDFLSPGLSSILLTKMGLSNFIPHFNIQGMACSTLPKLLELGKNLINSENDTILFVISGCNSGWYLPHLKDGMTVCNPKEIDTSQYDRDTQLSKWVSTMFSFLFGDGVAAFVMRKMGPNEHGLKIKKITHAVNFDEYDYRKACVRLVGNPNTHRYEHELTAGGDILNRTLDYSKKVITKSLNIDDNSFDSTIIDEFMSKQEKIMIHTGSAKILSGLQNLYKLTDYQIKESFETLEEYGNLTGVSIPTVLHKALNHEKSFSGNALLVGITMGFGLDIVEVENITN